MLCTVQRWSLSIYAGALRFSSFFFFLLTCCLVSLGFLNNFEFPLARLLTLLPNAFSSESKFCAGFTYHGKLHTWHIQQTPVKNYDPFFWCIQAFFKNSG